jgi:predicted DNA-binding transcriptional regulator AlpA
MTRDELAALPPVLDVPTAAKVLGIGRSLAYDLVRRGDWPTPVLHVGKLIKIPSAPLLALLSKQPEAALHADFVERSRS